MKIIQNEREIQIVRQRPRQYRVVLVNKTILLVWLISVHHYKYLTQSLYYTLHSTHVYDSLCSIELKSLVKAEH